MVYLHAEKVEVHMVRIVFTVLIADLVRRLVVSTDVNLLTSINGTGIDEDFLDLGYVLKGKVSFKILED